MPTKWSPGVAVHCNLQACRAVTLKTVNRQRACILLKHWLSARAVLSPAETTLR
ncbi:hypothetical protein T484DRAFT_1825801 [Baffinella frigidus]|nr:hypothetical protein T484DRAFT_1825801 [Cryptophyta sp. CCMP2293]